MNWTKYPQRTLYTTGAQCNIPIRLITLCVCPVWCLWTYSALWVVIRVREKKRGERNTVFTYDHLYSAFGSHKVPNSKAEIVWSGFLCVRYVCVPTLQTSKENLLAHISYTLFCTTSMALITHKTKEKNSIDCYCHHISCLFRYIFPFIFLFLYSSSSIYAPSSFFFRVGPILQNALAQFGNFSCGVLCVCVHSSLICNSPNSCAYLLSLCLFVELRFVVFPCAQNARRFISFEKLSTSGKWKNRRCCVVQLFSVVVIFFFVNTILCHTANNCPKYYRYVKLVPFLIDFFCKCSEMVCFPVF